MDDGSGCCCPQSNWTWSFSCLRSRPMDSCPHPQTASSPMYLPEHHGDSCNAPLLSEGVVTPLDIIYLFWFPRGRNDKGGDSATALKGHLRQWQDCCSPPFNFILYTSGSQTVSHGSPGSYTSWGSCPIGLQSCKNPICDLCVI